jgi:hypothetical protein
MPRLTAKVVFPAPPFRDNTAIVFIFAPCSYPASRRAGDETENGIE